MHQLYNVSFLNFTGHNCSQTLSSDGDMLESPNYPNNYPNNFICHTLIYAPQGRMVRLNITHFDLEPDGKEEGRCLHYYDTLRVYDGNDQFSPLLGEFCGSRAPERFQSSDRYLYVVFKSDLSIAMSGFQAFISFAGTAFFFR